MVAVARERVGVQTTDQQQDAGLFGPDSVTWRIHGDQSMALAGFRALLLQAVHPVVMAGFNDNTVWFDDMWGRLQRTGDWVGTVTYGTTAEAEKAGRVLRRIHAALPPGVEPESGVPYRVDDPELLRWVHVTEVESFLSTYRRCGGLLRPGDADRYVDEMRTSAELVGLERHTVPANEAEIQDYYDYVRPQLRVSKVAKSNTLKFLLPPMPRWVRLGTPARPAWAGMVGLGIAMLPPWARRLYGLPGLPTTDLLATANGYAVRRALAALPLVITGNPAYGRALRRTRTLAAA